MNDVIEKAKEAGLWEQRDGVWMAIGGEAELSRFAELLRRTQPEATQVAQYTCQRHVDEVKKGGACVWCQLEDAIAKSPMPGEVTLRAMYQPTNPPRLMGYDVIDASGKLIGVLKPDVWMGELPADGTKLYTAPAQDLSAAIFRDIAELEYDGLEQEEDVIKLLPNDLHLILDRHLASSANALSAGDIENTPVFNLLKRAIGVLALRDNAEAKAIAADARAILQSQKGAGHA